MDRRGFVAAFAGGFGLAAIGQLAQAKEASCISRIPAGEWRRIQHLYTETAKAINTAIDAHPKETKHHHLDIDISSPDTANAKFDALNRVYDDFATKGWIKTDNWQEVRKAAHVVQMAGCLLPPPEPAQP